MYKQLIKDRIGWGIGLWLIGYVLGIVLFPVVPSVAIGWVIMPIGVLITLWVLFKKIKGDTFGYFVKVGVAWTVIAVVFDYFFLVKFFHPADGYYKLDVYIYYFLTFSLPILVGWRKTKSLCN